MAAARRYRDLPSQRRRLLRFGSALTGDSSGSSPSDVGEVRISGVSFDTSPGYTTLASVIPEPASWALMSAGLGLVGMVGAVLRRRRARFA